MESPTVRVDSLTSTPSSISTNPFANSDENSLFELLATSNIPSYSDRAGAVPLCQDEIIVAQNLQPPVDVDDRLQDQIFAAQNSQPIPSYSNTVVEYQDPIVAAQNPPMPDSFLDAAAIFQNINVVEQSGMQSASPVESILFGSDIGPSIIQDQSSVLYDYHNMMPGQNVTPPTMQVGWHWWGPQLFGESGLAETWETWQSAVMLNEDPFY